MKTALIQLRPLTYRPSDVDDIDHSLKKVDSMPQPNDSQTAPNKMQTIEKGYILQF